MKNFILTCCSTADMPASFFEEKNIPFTCFYYKLDDQEYVDDLGKSMPFETFYEKMKAGAATSTSQPNVNQYMELFESALQEGLDVVHISLSSGISGAFNSANIARAELEENYPNQQSRL
ncbi:MAG: DegV family protein [Lachnospiraceae bacterium]